VTLKFRLEGTHSHWNWCHSTAWMWFPIHFP